MRLGGLGLHWIQGGCSLFATRRISNVQAFDEVNYEASSLGVEEG